ncbi:putative acetoacetate decarboxylase [compost metagenome]
MGSFVKRFTDIQKYGGKPTTFYDAEMLTLYWETKPEIIARLLPKPLKPASRPLVNAFVANYPATNFCPPYREAGLFVLADYNGQLGNYCLSMPITSDIGMAMGREVCGLPKKMADISLNNAEGFMGGTISRHGIDFVSMEARIEDRFNDSAAGEILDEYYGKDIPLYNIKYANAIDGSGFDLMPTLVTQRLVSDVKVYKAAEAAITFQDSPHDPWSELEVVNMLGAVYTVSTNVLEKGRVLEPLNPMEYLPYCYLRWDWWENKLQSGAL